jgi:hypothetical protein
MSNICFCLFSQFCSFRTQRLYSVIKSYILNILDVFNVLENNINVFTQPKANKLSRYLDYQIKYANMLLARI